MAHIAESDLALYSAGDLPLWRRTLVRLHVSGCPRCAERVDEYRETRRHVHALGDEMPIGVRWDKLSAEMAANIRVGLAAGECVTPTLAKPSIPTGWRVTAAISGFAALFVFAWWLNMPVAQTASLGRAMKALVGGPESRKKHMLGLDDASSLVRASAEGVEVRENGSAMSLTQTGARPVSVSLNTQGSARASYIDVDTGQVTITSVYAQ
jgi:anti-sigma factor RsiW